MTRVCLVGDDDVNLRYELLSRETSRDALQTYDLRAPYENTVGLETVSLGAAVSLLNDLNWYIVRFVDEALVLEPSVNDDEWLSRKLATAIRDDELSPGETGRLLKVYGVEQPETDADPDDSDQGSNRPGDDGGDQATEEGSDPARDDGDERGAAESGAADAGTPADPTPRLPRLVEPMLVTRTGERIPEYDIRDVDDTVAVRVTEAEFENRR